jgi:hypothetical protein
MLRTSTRRALARKAGISVLATAQHPQTKLIDVSDSFYNACLENLDEKNNPMVRTKYNKAFLQQMQELAAINQLPVVLRSEIESKRFVEANSHIELRRRNVVYSEIVDGTEILRRHSEPAH